VKKDELLVNLFIGSETKTSLNYCPITILQKTDYPFGGNVSLTINPEKRVNGKIKLLIPEWCKSYIAKLNGKKVSSNNLQLGYLTLDRKWRKGDVITLDFDMPVLLVESAPQVKGNAGKRAVQKGPLVYCMEQVDNPGVDLSSVVLTAKNKFNTLNGGGILKGVIKLQTIVGSNKITFIPYYAWENRESGKMLVWVKYL
jgi:DUF1680 family protein